jgi:hypothetical protein
MRKTEETTNIVAKKRGRKSKKEIEEALKNSVKNDVIFSTENITVNIEENETATNISSTMNFIDQVVHLDNEFKNDNQIENENIIENENDNENENENINISCIDNKPVAKKRGRKPKGGKIIQQILSIGNLKEPKPNVILHLKCSFKDLNSSNSLFGSSLEGFSFSNPNNLSYNIVNAENDFINLPLKSSDFEADQDSTDNDTEIMKNKENDIREVWKKLKVLEHNLHINNIDNKKSACFWDTCEFDNPPVYIPKHFMNETYHVYGCFCSPECAVAYLMEENIDSSIKFERYQLMNHIYSKIYNYNKNIKPAPNPYYMLEKYYGNLTTQEYRSLLRNERLFLVVDKPLTRIMPELHEDNDDFIINNKIIPTNNIKLRKLQRKQTKTNMLSERFGLNQ